MDASCLLPTSPDFPLISFEESLNLQDHSHAGHCVIYSRTSTPLFKGYVSTALISMQMRFDGMLGFPGGIVESGEDVSTSVNRELREEICLDPKFFISQGNHVMSNLNSARQRCLHFYAKEVSAEEFNEIEKDALKAEEHGIESLGLIRVPMFILRDGFRGLPSFLRNCFAGNAKDQLLNFLLHSNLMTFQELMVVLDSSRKGHPFYKTPSL